MFLRTVVTGVIACGLLSANSAAMAETADARMFKGKTAQGYRIKLQVENGKFKIRTFNIELRCRDKTWLILEEGGFLWTKTKSNGAFHDAQFGDTDSIYFRGRVTKRRIRGQIRATDKGKGEPFCATHWVKFNATAQ
jgi:hypothetical protein